MNSEINNEIKTEEKKTPHYLKRLSTIEKDLKQLTVRTKDLERRLANVLKSLKR